MLTRVSMIMLGVGDLAASVAFYHGTLGLKLQSQSGEFAFLDAGGGLTIALSAPLGKAVNPRAGAMELIFPVDSVAAAHAELKGLGCLFLNAPRNVAGTQYAATFTDPDGHKLTLFGNQ